ncbi:hypothetical protein B0H13DRAFT_1869765 [Mycena leptocephala]|nr:hypothetical protein B0H13DRAFT_1869765 [Mycena leptocephala]
MTSKSSQVDRPAPDAEEDRRRRHADAQKRYREKNLEKTRTKARLRMERQVIYCATALLTRLVSLRSARELSEEATRLAAEQRRIVDADYRERKFIEKFGQRAFIEYYLPLHHVFGNHLPGRQFVWSDEVDKKRRRSRKPKSKSKVAVGTTDHLS